MATSYGNTVTIASGVKTRVRYVYTVTETNTQYKMNGTVYFGDSSVDGGNELVTTCFVNGNMYINGNRVNVVGYGTSSVDFTVTFDKGTTKTAQTARIAAVWRYHNSNDTVVSAIDFSVNVSAKGYTVSYNANGGSSTPASQTKIHGTTLTLRAGISRSNATATYTVKYSANYTGGTNPSNATATKTTKYTFNKWNTKSDGSGTAYAASGQYTANAAATLYATWTSNTGTTKVTLPTMTRTGYTFVGWYTSGGTKVGNGGASYTPTASVTLYAHWSVITYTVAYNANSGSGAPSSQTKTYGVTLTLSSTKPTRTGYNFRGWNTKADGSGTSYAAGASYTANAAATLYAQWTVITYTVSYNANGGTGAPSSQTKKYGVPLVLDGKVPTRTNYSFLHWNTKSDNSGTAYTQYDNYTANASATLYAIWNAIISYNANGGSGAPASQTKAYGTDLTLSSTKPTRTGLTFAGWGTSSTATTVSYAAGAKYTSNTAATLYAIWKYTVNFNGNGNGVNPTAQTAVYGHNVTIAGYPTRSGYRFLGWNSEQDGTGTHYAPGTSVAVNENCTLYAQWRKVTVSSVKVTRNGTSVGFTSTWSCSSTVGGTVAVTAQYSLDDGDSWHDCTLTGDATKTKVAGTDLSGTVSWSSTVAEDNTVRVMVTAEFTDSYSSTAISGGHVETAQRGGTIPKEFRLLDALHGGTGLAIGAIATLANIFEVALTTVFNNVAVNIKSTNIDRDGETPTENQWGKALSMTDVDGNAIGVMDSYRLATGESGVRLIGYAGPNGASVYNTFRVGKLADGTNVYYITDPPAFREAANAVGATNQELQNAMLTSLGGATQLWALRTNVINSNNTAYHNHNTGLSMSNTGAFLYDFTAQGTIWSAYTTKNPQPADAWDVSKTTTVSQVITAESGRTVSSVTYAEWGKVAMLSVSISGWAASTGSQTGGTVVSGKRPVYNVYATDVSTSYAVYAQLTSSGALTVYWGTAPGTSTSYTIRFIYILA